MNPLDTLDNWLLQFLDRPANVAAAVLGATVVLLAVPYFHQVPTLWRFAVKNLARSPVRTGLTGLATAVLVLVVTMVWSALELLDGLTNARAADLQVVVTERWQIPSQMPVSYEASLADGAARSDHPEDVRPSNSMGWSFFGGTIDASNQTRENIIFFICMEPSKLIALKNGKIESMMDDIDKLTPARAAALDAACRKMKEDPRLVLVGRERLKALNKRVGERIKVISSEYTGIELEMEILAELPPGRYDTAAVMNREYLLRSLDHYKAANGVAHPMAEKCLNLFWLRVSDTAAFGKLAEQIETSSRFTRPAVKCESASSGAAGFLDGYRDLLWGMRWLLVPAVLSTMALVIANAIGISIRERRVEMAVLKVLGFGPNQILLLVLGEAMLIGGFSGLASAGGAYLFINHWLGGIQPPLGPIPPFLVPVAACWQGPAIGGLTALAGSLPPAWSARSIRAAEVFSRTA
jgi:putative ABC transport system permease protein